MVWFFFNVIWLKKSGVNDKYTIKRTTELAITEEGRKISEGFINPQIDNNLTTPWLKKIKTNRQIIQLKTQHRKFKKTKHHESHSRIVSRPCSTRGTDLSTHMNSLNKHIVFDFHFSAWFSSLWRTLTICMHLNLNRS